MDSHTLIQALIYLGAAALIVPVAVRLGLGSVLGYLIAGCIIGPWGFRLVTDAEAILHFAEIGVVLMLFVIGLELIRSVYGNCVPRCLAVVHCRCWPVACCWVGSVSCWGWSGKSRSLSA